jgi:hypothetical protein
MASIAELIDSRQYTRDRNGKEAGTRVFRVLEAQNEAGARDEFYALTDHNRFPGASIGCILDRVNVEGRNGNTLFIVTASYSSFGGFLKRDEPEEAFVPFFGWGYKKVTVTLPFIYAQDVTTNSGEASVTKTVWNAKTLSVPENRLIRTLKVRYQTDNSNTLDVIAEQDRKLHRIRGKQYLFTGADVQQDLKDPSVFLITYNWEQDNGTKVLTSPKVRGFVGGMGLGTTLDEKPEKVKGIGYICGAVDGQLLDIVYAAATLVTMRMPYYQIDLVAQATEDGAPKPVPIRLYDEDDDGWQQLPGMIPL